ncbi:MAG: glycosyltransferase family protein [Azoarcus sp.]|jgi:GT2 family glycosyltransferase|nr:glycosyltransferase family protein [Azoarcus sp.]
MNPNASFSVIVCSIDALKFTQTSQCYERILNGFSYEIIGIHDAHSLAEGYNRAINRSRGDFLIFSHDDILILDSCFGHKISRRLQDFDILGMAGSRRAEGACWFSSGNLFGAIAHAYLDENKLELSLWSTHPWPVVDGIQCIDGLCIMTRRDVAEEIRFDETTFDGFHLYDLDFSFSAWQAGKKLGVCCDIPVIHASTGSYDKKHAYYSRLFIEKHRSALPAKIPKIKQPLGPGIPFSSHQSLCAMWQKEILQRSWLAYLRRPPQA